MRSLICFSLADFCSLLWDQNSFRALRPVILALATCKSVFISQVNKCNFIVDFCSYCELLTTVQCDTKVSKNATSLFGLLRESSKKLRSFLLLENLEEEKLFTDGPINPERRNNDVLFLDTLFIPIHFCWSMSDLSIAQLSPPLAPSRSGSSLVFSAGA